MPSLRLNYAFIMAGFMGLAAGLPLVLIICCATVLFTRIVREEYLPLTYGAGIALSLMAAFGPLVTMWVGITMLVMGTLWAYLDT